MENLVSLPAPSTQSPKPIRVVVLGGGPCGLYAARRLVTQPGFAVTVVEREAVPGGLATSHRRGANYYDLGTHMLHEFDKEICDDVLAIMGDESFPVELNAKIRWAGSFYRYPLQFSDMIKGIPPWTLFKCVAGLLIAQARQKLFPREPKNAEEALQQLYGDMLYRFFFKDFTHRYWGFPTTEMSATFITSKMPRLTAVDMIKKILAKFGIKDSVKAVDSALLEETLHYARTGAEAMPRHLAQFIRDHGGRVLLDRPVSAIERGPDGRVTAVRYRHTETGEEGCVEADHVINTIPLKHLLAAIPDVPPAVQEAVRHLHYKPITIHGLLVNKPRCLDALYIYYRERLFHRIGEPKNAGLVVTPSDHTVLIIETTCEMGDDKWNATPAVREQIMADLEAEAICTRDQIVEWHVLHAETGYPVFRLGFEPYHEAVKAFLNTIPNLQSTGRQGGFSYPNMHSAMRMGAKAADAVVRQVR
ncbi:MAG: FAD-dependent oxidoreductase [Verrucomicrobiales bacterium]